MIEVHRLAKRFGRVEALRDVSFKTRKGTITAMLGENGAGKTTTLKIVLGFLRPDSGTVAIAPGRVGYVPDRPAYFAWLDGWTILGLARPRGRGTPRATAATSGRRSSPPRRAFSSIPALLRRRPGLLLGRERQEVLLPAEPRSRARPPRRRRAVLRPRSAVHQVRPGRLLRPAGVGEDGPPQLPHAGRDGEDRRRLRRPAPRRDDRPRRPPGMAAPALGPDRSGPRIRLPQAGRLVSRKGGPV